MSGPLPDPVRQRVVALASDALPALAREHVPATLRRVADFAPARRARLAGNQIAAALETDDEFRGRVATHVRTVVPALAKALEDGTAPPAADPVEVAALAYLLRPHGWVALVEPAQQESPAPAETPDTDRAMERLRRQLSEARAQARIDRERLRGQVGDLKAENAELRRKLNEARQRLKQAEEDAAQAAEATQSQAGAAAQLEAEVRRLRARVGELEAATSASRRSAREEREQATVRTRLLLDTLLESVQGLRRELALPPTTGSPADTVDAVAPAEAAAATTRARRVDDPALLQELLALPRVHLVVDGYNVTKTAWENAPLDAQRDRLIRGLAPVVAQTQAEVTVVFDGADLTNPPPVSSPRGVRVVFSPPGVIADVTIGQLVAAEPAGRPVVVVSSDREVAEHAQRSGARPVAAAALVALLRR